MKLFAWILVVLILAVSVIYPASLTTRTVYGRTTVNANAQSVPTSPTDLTTTDTWVFQLVINNTTAGALTFSLCDKQGTPVCLFYLTPIAAYTTYVLPFPEGLKFESGLNWTSSGSGIKASVSAWKD